MLETAGAVSEEEQMQEPAARKTRRRKTGKNRSGLKALLLVLQHASLAVMVFAVIVVTACTTVRIEGTREGKLQLYQKSRSGETV